MASDGDVKIIIKDKVLMDKFLESTPPGTTVIINKADIEYSVHKERYFKLPEIKLYCPNEECKGERFFYPNEDSSFVPNDIFKDVIIDYTCKNCQEYMKTFALRSIYVTENEQLDIFKFGEWPAFGPPTSSKLVNLVKEEKEYFFMGRRCESQSMGIGAFVYYRRVIENQKDRIIEQIIKVSKILEVKAELIEELENAKKEKRFSKAVESIKHGIPESLLIYGKNPLTLLHNALSKGLHSLPDAECLELAQNVRLILTELSDRLAQALKDDKALKDAVSKLSK